MLGIIDPRHIGLNKLFEFILVKVGLYVLVGIYT